MAGQPLIVTLSIKEGHKQPTVIRPLAGLPIGPVNAAGSASVVGTPITGSSAASPLTLVVPSVVAGHALIVAVANGSGSTNAFTVTDDKGNAWGTKVTDGWVSGGSFTRVELWAAFNVAGGTTTITCTSAGTNLQGIAMEVANASSLDVASTAGSGIAAGTTSDDQTPDILSTTADSFYVAAINGSTSGSVVFSHGNVGNFWTELVPPVVSSTGLRVGYASVAGVGRRHDGWARSNGTAATGTLTVAFKAAVAVDNRNATLSITGGGVTIVTGTKAGFVADAITGGGDILPSGTKAGFVTDAVTGGGDILPVGRKAAAATASITGGGDILVTGRKGAAAAVTLTGGGDILLSGNKNGKLSMSLTGGGVVSVSETTSRTLVDSITGGGDILISFKKDVSYTISITGGGVVTIQTQDVVPPPVILVTVVQDQAGAGPVRQRRQQDRLDDWTLTDDDEAVLEIYATRVR